MSKYSISSHKILRYILSKYMLSWFHIIDHFASHYTNLILQHRYSILSDYVVSPHYIRMHSFYQVTYHMTLCQITVHCRVIHVLHDVVAYNDTRPVLL